MDFKQLHSFISVVRCRSFTEAAEELGISQPKALKSPLEAWNFLNVPKTF